MFDVAHLAALDLLFSKSKPLGPQTHEPSFECSGQESPLILCLAFPWALDINRLI